MPKVTMRRQISGTRNGKPWPAPGETVDVSKSEADTLIRQGNAAKPKSSKKDDGS